LIGDPSGRSTERPYMDEVATRKNMLKLSASVKGFFERAGDYVGKRMPSPSASYAPPLVMNNIEWFKNLGVLEFMRVVGTAARVNSMIARERQAPSIQHSPYSDVCLSSVQSRLNSQQGISFSEFSYQLLQAYDFLVLHKTTGCTIQVGGSDQWGNIIAGLELIGRTCGTSNGTSENAERSYGITTPLLTTSSGAKFGKSAGNAIWLNEELTTAYDFYQVSVIRYGFTIDLTSPAVLHKNK
jgi:tyrosyl-tRNA synthetase